MLYSGQLLYTVSDLSHKIIFLAFLYWEMTAFVEVYFGTCVYLQVLFLNMLRKKDYVLTNMYISTTKFIWTIF